MGCRVSQVKAEPDPLFGWSEKANPWPTHFFNGLSFTGQKRGRVSGSGQFLPPPKFVLHFYEYKHARHIWFRFFEFEESPTPLNENFLSEKNLSVVISAV